MLTIAEQRELWKLIREYAENAARLAGAEARAMDREAALARTRFEGVRAKLASFIQSHTEKNP